MAALTNSSNLTEHFKYNVTDVPGNPSELMGKSNEFMGGGLAIGMVGVLWLIIVSALLYRDYRYLQSMIAANLVTTLSTFILFLGGYMGGEIPLLLIVVTAGTLLYSVSGTR